MTDSVAGADAQQPQRLGRYVLLKLLAAGGMAEIYVARHLGIEGFKKLVIVKRIHKHLALDPKFVEMFFDEARIAALLNHPNIVQIFDLGRVDGHPFIAMEYVEGTSLRDVQQHAGKAEAPMPWPLAVWLVARACEGLAHAHELKDDAGQPAGLVHRDISPHNLLVSFDGSLKIVDFGIARATIRMEQTQSGSRKGKLRYMSPEQALGMPLDRRSDLFSLGTVLWELLSNSRLFDAQGEMSVLQQITSDPIPDPTVASGPAPEELLEVTRRALQREPEDRFADANAMAEALESVLRHAPKAPSARALAEYLGGLVPAEMESTRADAAALLALDVSAYEVAEYDGTHAEGRVSSETKELGPPPSLPGVSRATRGLLWALGGAVLAVIIMSGAFFVGRMQQQEPTPTETADIVPSGPAANPTPLEPAPAPPRPTVAAPASKTEPATIAVTSKPSGATVRIGGKKVGATPLTALEVPAGKHTVRVERNGYRSATRTVEATAGEAATVALTLKALPPPAGTLAFDTRPWSIVYLGNRKLGETPLLNVRLPAGTHTLRVMPKGSGPARQVKVTVKAGRLTRRLVNL